MKRPRCGLLRLALCLACLVLFAGSPPPAVAQAPRPRFGEGTHTFRHILHDLELKPLSRMDQVAEDPEHTLIIVLGETGAIDDIPDGLLGFVQRGGAALVATDRTWDWRPRRDVHLYIRGAKVEATNPETAYRDILECPLVEAVPAARPQLFGTALPLGANAATTMPVATNLPSYVYQSQLVVPRGLEVLAQFPEGCRYDERKVARQPFAVGGPLGEGRLLVLADHSVFINDMMLQPDTGNIDFTYDAIEWLTNNLARTRILFIEEGAVNDVFNIPLKQLPPQIPPVDAFVPAFNQAIVNLDKDDVLNKQLLALIPFDTLLVLLVLLLTLLLAAYGFTRLARARHRIDIWSPLFDRMLVRQGPARPLLEQRQRALLSKGNFWEPACALARQAFTAAGAAPEPLREPAIVSSGTWWRRWLLARRVRRLWRLAQGRIPVRVSAQEFARLGEDLRAVEAALAAGTLQLTFPQSRADPRAPTVRERLSPGRVPG